MIELKPLGPRESLQPGQKAAFTETWELQPFEFPEPGMPVDLQQLKRVAGVASR